MAPDSPVAGVDDDDDDGTDSGAFVAEEEEEEVEIGWRNARALYRLRRRYGVRWGSRSVPVGRDRREVAQPASVA